MNYQVDLADADHVDHEAASNSDRRRAASGWLISGGFHVLILLIMYGVYWVVQEPRTETPPVRPNLFLPPEQPPKQPHVTLDEPKVVPIDTDQPQVTTPMVPLEPTETPAETDDNNPDTTPKGDPSAVADSNMASQGLVSAAGPGGSDKGLLGLRGHGGHHRGGGQYGATRGTENSVESALRWFKKHQSANGMWDAINFYRNCTEDPRCEPGAEAHGGPANYDVAMTAYALLCYLGDGYDQVSANKYRSVVRRGLDYLLSVQHADGYFGERNYEHAVATMVICEAYAMTSEAALKDPAQRALHQIIAHENLDQAAQDAGGSSSAVAHGMGWDYVAPGVRNDASVSGWNIMALKDGLAAGLIGTDALDGPKHWLEVVWKKQNPDWGHLDPYTGETRFPYTYQTDTGATEIAPAPGAKQPGPNDHDLTCVGAACAVFLGHHADDPMLNSMSTYISNHYVPSAWPANVYYLYYNSMTMFQVGGEKWKQWQRIFNQLLIPAQRTGSGCFAGSWDWAPGSFIGGETGRVLTTAYACLSLEVYWRYKRLSELRH